MDWSTEAIIGVSGAVGAALTGLGAWVLKLRSQNSAEALKLRAMARAEKAEDDAKSNRGYEMVIDRLDKEKTARDAELCEMESRLNKMSDDHHQCRQEYAAVMERVKYQDQQIRSQDEQLTTLRAELQSLRAKFELHRQKGHERGEPDTTPPMPSPIAPAKQ